MMCVCVNVSSGYAENTYGREGVSGVHSNRSEADRTKRKMMMACSIHAHVDKPA